MLGDGWISSPAVDGAHVDSAFHQKVTAQTPTGPPAVADDPKFAIGRISSITNDDDRVIDRVLRTRRVVEHAGSNQVEFIEL